MVRTGSLIVLLALAVGGAAAVGCGRAAPPAASQGTPDAAPASGRSGGGAAGGSGTFQIVFLGDSLTSGYGLLSEQAYPAIVQTKFAAEGYTNVETVNAGISADTTAGGLRRVEQVLGPDTKILVVALGGNDFIRGLSVSQTHDNLAGIIDVALNRNVAVLVAGMEATTNLGEDYRTAFRESFTRLLSEYRGRISLMPFLLEGVGGVPSLNQSDGIHPNADGARMVAEAIYPRLRTMVDSMGGGH
jgi:acyl-CoA thioesterase-1